ncbi:hypothetical protein J3E68DRAFT_162251 [Trichoderma sp. SZMC 28012]
MNLNLIPARHHGTQTKTQSMDGNWLQLGCTGTLTRKLVPALGGTHAAQASRGARKVPRGRGYIWVWTSGATQGAKVTPFFAWVWVWLCLGPWKSPLSLDQVPLRKRSTVHLQGASPRAKTAQSWSRWEGKGVLSFPHVLFYFSRI